VSVGGGTLHALGGLHGRISGGRGKPTSEFLPRYLAIWRPPRNALVCGTVLHLRLQGEADDINPVTIGLSTFARLQA
jgi:hypothetical protein